MSRNIGKPTGPRSTRHWIPTFWHVLKLRHNPAYLDGHVNLALAYFRADRYDEARRSAERALALDPQNEMAQKILAAI